MKFNDEKYKNRQTNFELMRIVSMLLIILWHIIIHGHIIEICQNEILKVIFQMILYIIIIHVNSFIVLMGYFQSISSFKIRKVTKIIGLAVFYSIVLSVISFKVGFIKELSLITIASSNLPSIVLDNYWFLSSYLIVYCLSDIINALITRLTKNEYRRVLLIVFLLISFIPFITGQSWLNNSGYNFYSFVLLYLIGGYLRKYPINQSWLNKKTLFLCFMLCAYINFLIILLCNYIDGNSNLICFMINRISNSKLYYSTPLVIIQTICYFEIFKNLNLKCKLINCISKNLLAVYIIHDNVYIRENIYKLLVVTDIINNNTLLIIVSLTFIIFIVCIMIDKIREIVFNCVGKFIRKCIIKCSNGY